MQMFNQMIDYVMQFWDSHNKKFTYSSESGDAKKPHTFMFIGSTGMSVAYAAATMLSMVFHVVLNTIGLPTQCYHLTPGIIRDSEARNMCLCSRVDSAQVFLDTESCKVCFGPKPTNLKMVISQGLIRMALRTLQQRTGTKLSEAADAPICSIEAMLIKMGYPMTVPTEEQEQRERSVAP